MNPFRKKPTPLEQAKIAQRETKSTVRSNQRHMERDIRDLDRQEKLVMQQIRQRAKSNSSTAGPLQNDPALKALAKQLVQIRQQKAKMYETKAHLSSVGMQASAMASQVSMVTAVSNVTSAISSANDVMDAKALGKTMAEFSKQNETAKMKEELMNDALADAFDNDDVEAEAEDVTSQILAELGVELDAKMLGLDAPSKLPPAMANEKNSNKEQDLTKEEEDALFDLLPDLKARLDALWYELYKGDDHHHRHDHYSCYTIEERCGKYYYWGGEVENEKLLLLPGMLGLLEMNVNPQLLTKNTWQQKITLLQ